MAFKKGSKLNEQQEVAKRGGVCAKCKGEYDCLTVDHVVPVSILEMLDGGEYWKYEGVENFQFLCRVCNSFKSNRLDKTNPNTFIVLEDLVNQGKKLSTL